MTSGKWGLLAFLAFSTIWMGAAAVWSLRASGPSAPAPPDATGRGARAPDEVASKASRVPPVSPSVALLDPGDARAELLTRRLLDIIVAGREGDESDELARVEQELLALGERAAPPIVARLMVEGSTQRRDLLLDFLRRVPGSAAETFMIREARSGAAGSSRSIAMDALAERSSEASLQALGQIATTDPELPSQPLITNVRVVEDTSTELPDEVDYTPRMKAMAALATTHDARAMATLVSILQTEREESLRMQAAQYLLPWRAEPGVLEVLRSAAARDSSRYVRLAALHTLDGLDVPGLMESFREIVARDPDPGVRLLAQALLERTSTPRD